MKCPYCDYDDDKSLSLWFHCSSHCLHADYNECVFCSEELPYKWSSNSDDDKIHSDYHEHLKTCLAYAAAMLSGIRKECGRWYHKEDGSCPYE